MKIVIIAYNSYPKLSPRAHRATELAKEFVKEGHQVVLYALLGNYDYSKISKETGIEFKNLGISRLGVPDNMGYMNNSYFAIAIRRLFGKMFMIPYIELMPMVKKALKREGSIDFLITIAHPHTIHWGTSSYVKKNKNKIKFWVADCGDPLMGDPFNNYPTYFKYREKRWCSLCSYITVPIKSAKDGYYPEFKNKIKVIPQGFDYSSIYIAEYQRNDVPTFAFSGMMYPGKRDLFAFLDFLVSWESNFKFIVYTEHDYQYATYKSKLKDKLELRNYVKRDKLLYELSKMDFLINIKNISEVQVPSKLIDYAYTSRPILEISTSFEEKEIFNEFVSGNYVNAKIIPNIQQYDIKNICTAFLELIVKNSMC